MQRIKLKFREIERLPPRLHRGRVEAQNLHPVFLTPKPGLYSAICLFKVVLKIKYKNK